MCVCLCLCSEWQIQSNVKPLYPNENFPIPLFFLSLSRASGSYFLLCADMFQKQKVLIIDTFSLVLCEILAMSQICESAKSKAVRY